MVDLVGVSLAALAALGLAGQALFVRLGTRQGRSADALVVVLLINIAILVPLAAVLSYPDYGLTPVSILAFVAAGVMGTMIGRAFLYAGIKEIGASRAEPIKASMPLHATILAVLVLGESLTAVHLGAVVLIVVGVALVSWESSRSTAAFPKEVTLAGLALPFAAAFFFGLEPIFAKFGFAEGTPYLVGLALKMVAASVGFIAYLRVRNQLPSPRDLRRSNLRWYGAAGVASTAFLLAYYAALSIAPVAIVVPIMQSSPLFVAVLSLLFLQRLERVTWRLVGAASVVVVGAVVVTLSS